MWIKNLSGEKAQIDDTDREHWGLHGWTITLAPTHGEFVWMRHPDLGEPSNPIPWGGEEGYWQKMSWAPGPPPTPVNPTRDPALTDVTAELPPDGTADAVTEWVGGDQQRAEQALVAELTRPKPRKTVVDALQNVGQPDVETSAAPSAPNKEA